jgi:glutamine synthetase
MEMSGFEHCNGCRVLTFFGYIWQMHSESGGGQFEIAMSHVPCLTAADNLLFIREAVVAIANKHLLHATFLPK